METGKQYTDSYSVSLKGVKDIANTSIVAMIIDQETGLIINATEKKLKTVGISAWKLKTPGRSKSKTA